jgi:hypothetical protein
MTEKEAWGQAFENGRQKGDAEGYARGLKRCWSFSRWWRTPNTESSSDAD